MTLIGIGTSGNRDIGKTYHGGTGKIARIAKIAEIVNTELTAD
jgi:hypothetical protein